jgi:hypothetical protein
MDFSRSKTELVSEFPNRSLPTKKEDGYAHVRKINVGSRPLPDADLHQYCEYQSEKVRRRKNTDQKTIPN